MPKQVDHAARWTEIAHAALRLCARDGLAGLSMGQVAQEAGGPAGVLRRALLAVVWLGAHAPVLLLAGHAFLARAVAGPDVLALYRTGGAAVHREIAALLTAASDPGIDADTEAHILLGLARGLADGVLVGELDLARAAAVLDHQLARLGTTGR
ncbi:TetR family transcriptional regulator C-terminal domain-containing protein [Nonomuraea sp. NPDC004702]